MEIRGNGIGIALTIAMMLLLGSSITINPARAQPVDIVAFKTQHPFTLDGIPSETFWAQIPVTSVPTTTTETT